MGKIKFRIYLKNNFIRKKPLCCLGVMRYHDDFVGYSNFLTHFIEGYQDKIETSPNALEIIVVVFSFCNFLPCIIETFVTPFDSVSGQHRCNNGCEIKLTFSLSLELECTGN